MNCQVLIYEGTSHSFYAISEEVRAEIVGLSDREWGDFLVGAAVLEGSIESGRPPGIVVVPLEDSVEGLHVLDLTIFGGSRKIIWSRRGHRVLIAHVVRGRRIGKKEREIAEAAIRKWRRKTPRRRADTREG